MSVSIEEIKRLKELTGVGLTDAKKALTEVDGDFDKALEAMRKKGLTKAEKKGEREARQGVVDTYLHSGRIGVVIEVNCETDFVARTDDFKNFVHDVAMHVAAASPEYIFWLTFAFNLFGKFSLFGLFFRFWYILNRNIFRACGCYFQRAFHFVICQS